MECISNHAKSSYQGVLRELHFRKMALTWSEEWIGGGSPELGDKRLRKANLCFYLNASHVSIPCACFPSSWDALPWYPMLQENCAPSSRQHLLLRAPWLPCPVLGGHLELFFMHLFPSSSLSYLKTGTGPYSSLYLQHLTYFWAHSRFLNWAKLRKRNL